MSTVECHNLIRKFGDFTAVDNLSLVIEEGELFGLLGPNGAGKTTTIKMLTGLIPPTSGTASICGFDICVSPLDAKRHFGYIPDNPFLYEKLTGIEYLNFMGDLYGVSNAGRSESVNDLLNLFALEDKGNEMIQGYSRGMRQKLALAGALIHAPKVIILDEPTVGLDPQSARAMQEILRELCKRGTTVLISTHILNIAEKLCDRVCIIDHGRVIAQGIVEDLLEESRNRNTGATDSSPLTLEDVFLELTGGTEYAGLIRYLR